MVKATIWTIGIALLPIACSLSMKELPASQEDETDAGIDGAWEGGETSVDAQEPLDAANDVPDAGESDAGESDVPDAEIREPILLAGGQDGPTDLAVDDTYVYWLNMSVGAQGTVSRMPLDGSSGPVVIAEGQFYPTRIVVYEDSLFWIDRGGGLWTAKIPGDKPQRIGGVSGSDCWGLGASQGRVFMTTRHSVEEFPLPNGPFKTWAANEHDALALTVVDQMVYWTNDKPGGAIRRSAWAGSPETLATGQGSSSGITVDDTYVYWTSWEHGSVARIPLQGGEVERLSTGEYYPSGIAVDKTHVYWVTEGSFETASGSLFRKSLSGGSRETLAEQQWVSQRLALTDTHVYWATFGSNKYASGTIMKIRK